MVYCKAMHIMESKCRIHKIKMVIVVCAFDQDAQKVYMSGIESIEV